MKLSVTKAEVWTAELDDQVGGTAAKLEPLARAGANLELVLARRTAEQPGKGILFVYPVKGARVQRAAREAGLVRSDSVHAIRVEGGDQAGLGARMARALGDAGISLRGLTAIAPGRKFISFIAFDSAADAARAASVLKRLS